MRKLLKLASISTYILLFSIISYFLVSFFYVSKNTSLDENSDYSSINSFTTGEHIYTDYLSCIKFYLSVNKDANNLNAEDFCVAIFSKHSAASQSELQKIDPIAAQGIEIAKHLKFIPSRYNIPDHLIYGHSTEISFVLEPQGPGSGADRLEGLPGRVETATVPVSPQVQALLHGPADKVVITPRGENNTQRKAITPLAPVQWVWDVKAIGEGAAVLQLELIAFIPNKDKEANFQARTFRRQIPIQILQIDRAKRFVADISPIWTFIVTVLAGFGGLLAYFGWKPSFRRP